MTPMPIPADPGELSAAWLTTALRASDIISVSTVTAREIDTIGSDRGFTGVVARLQLTYDRTEAGAPASLVAKFPMAQRQGSSYRDAQQTSPEQAQRYWERCAREITFYRQIGPGTDVVPKVYGTWTDPATRWMLLLLEDLSAGQPGDALLGCSIEQATLVVDQMASFHAGWWGRTNQTELEWLPRWGHDPAAMAARFPQQLELVLDQYSERIPKPVAEMAWQLATQYEPMLRALAGSPGTVVHGDLHLDNMIFGGSRSVTLLDWQGIAVGPAIVDLGLFLVGSLSVADRQVAEMELLARYHRLLMTAGVDGYTFGDLVDDYLRSLVWQLAGIVGWLARVDLTTLAGRERALVDALLTSGHVLAACSDHAERIASLAGGVR